MWDDLGKKKTSVQKDDTEDLAEDIDEDIADEEDESLSTETRDLLFTVDEDELEEVLEAVDTSQANALDIIGSPAGFSPSFAAQAAKNSPVAAKMRTLPPTVVPRYKKRSWNE